MDQAGPEGPPVSHDHDLLVEVALVDLLQSIVRHGAEAQSLSDALGCLPGPPQRAGVKGGDGLLGLGQPPGDEGRFPLALLIQRYLIPPLPATVKVAMVWPWRTRSSLVIDSP